MVSRVRNFSSGSTAATRYRFGEFMSVRLLPLPIVVPSSDRLSELGSVTPESLDAAGPDLVDDREVLVEQVPGLDDLGRGRELARVETRSVEGQVERAEGDALRDLLRLARRDLEGDEAGVATHLRRGAVPGAGGLATRGQTGVGVRGRGGVGGRLSD